MRPGPWSYTFEEHGGYDAMSSAYWIYDANGEHILDVDCRRFDEDASTWEESHRPCKEAEEVAALIVAASQKYGKETK